MHLKFFRASKPSEALEEEIELDITPLMNIFIILVAFLISMAIFTKLAIVEFTLPPNVDSSMNNSEEKPQPKITVRLDKLYVGLVLGDKLLDSLPVVNSEIPFDSLSMRLKLRSSETDFKGEIVVASVDQIPFKTIVKAMDICRGAGFSKVGLSSATTDPGASQ
ncbi:MAG: ExbD/TolR family protein [Fibrobacterota bacterium]|nr:biopolymer transporter ExbD [Chitinispirillaceae bacterium]